MCRRRPERHGVSVKENVPARGRPPGLAKTCSGHVPEDMPQGCGAVPVGIPHTTCYSILVNCESPVLRLQFGRKSKGKRPCTARACPVDISCPMTFFSCPGQGSAPRLCSRISSFSLAARSPPCSRITRQRKGMGRLMEKGTGRKRRSQWLCWPMEKFFSPNCKKMLAKEGQGVYNPSSLERGAPANRIANNVAR